MAFPALDKRLLIFRPNFHPRWLEGLLLRYMWNSFLTASSATSLVPGTLHCRRVGSKESKYSVIATIQEEEERELAAAYSEYKKLNS